ncbi:HAD-IC family P-type ATPase [Hydrogenophaga sp. PAMC20947]|uniref:cation-translocating P-type ATPase n=1 Tax=Hydrogenophaga sp. PAMC20947 TaxID=2565558 RepID=UPI00109E2382|nr:HAD-IC family P-type ATPase [Hydrogenophaga sp. PAMC20947]QCB46585.1 HAD family hydrolase [Hydrogenophaga sp. PAMC20947]
MTNDAYRTESPVWHAVPTDQVLQSLASDAQGLSAGEVQARLDRHGPNRLPAAPPRPWWRRLLAQFHNLLIYVLLAAALITLWLGHYLDTAVIVGVVVINAIMGLVQEGKAQRALEAVRAMLASHATVVRQGLRQEVDAGELVPGDVVLLESGTRVPADLRLLRSKNLAIDEAALTGESVPSGKQADAVAHGAALGDRACMAYAGTVVTVGQASGVVVATARDTEIGKIGAMVAGVAELVTPLTQRLDQFARRITGFIVVVALFTFAYGVWFGGMPAADMFLVVVGLAVAAIPEGLPAVVTITLAIGTSIMAQHRAVVRRLPAVEALGSVSVICTDKTGTLTRNEMTAVRVMLSDTTLAVSGAGYAPLGGFDEAGSVVDPAEHAGLQRLARCALLCNDAHLHHDGTAEDSAKAWTLAGDPTEGALLTLALKAGLDREGAGLAFPRRDEIPFESEHRYMATLHHDHEACVFVLLKGAPERVLDLCVQDTAGAPLDRRAWQAQVDQAARDGQRVLALAECSLPGGTTALSMADIVPRFTLLGLVGLMDPPRPEAVAAVAECQRAGIRVVMITGDHAVTAAAIGQQLGLQAQRAITGEEIDHLDDAALSERLVQTDVVARASPAHKLRLVASLQAQGKLVAMTGDGVNDAPALKAANIGVAMGLRGTDAAREAADLVLTDDNFAAIAHAVREGRTVFDNIKKSLLFVLPTNGGEAGVILLAVFAGLAMPVTAAQILWVNMVTTVTLAIALAFEPGEGQLMQRPPRDPNEPLITRLLFARIAYVTLLMIVATYTVFHWEMSRGSSIEVARTAVVNMLVVGELVYLFNVRHFTAHALAWETLTGNLIAFWASVSLVVFQMLFTYASPMQQLFGTAALGWSSWAMILGLASVKFLAVEAEKWVLRRQGVLRM